MMDAISLLEQASRIVRDAGNLLFCREMAEQVREKGRTDFVTAVDTEAQAQIREQLLELDDSIQFMGEEQDNASLALAREGTVLLGMI